MSFDQNQVFETRDPKPTRARTRELEEAGPSFALASSTTVTQPKRINASAVDGCPIAAPTGVAEEAKKAEAVEASNDEEAQKKEADRKAKKAAWQREYYAKNKVKLADNRLKKKATATADEIAAEKEKHAAYQREWRAKKRAKATDDEIAAEKEKNAAYQREWRAKKRAKATDDEIAAEKGKNAAYQREYRAMKKATATDDEIAVEKERNAAWQREWRAKKRAKATDDEIAAEKERNAAYQRKYLAKKKAGAATDEEAKAAEPADEEEVAAKKKRRRLNASERKDREKVIALLNHATLTLKTITQLFTTHEYVEIPIETSKAFADATLAALVQIKTNEDHPMFQLIAPQFQAVAVREIEEQPGIAIPLVHTATFMLVDIANAFKAMTYDFPQETASAFVKAASEAERRVRRNSCAIQRWGGAVAV